jgi:hypothetical protein
MLHAQRRELKARIHQRKIQIFQEQMKFYQQNLEMINSSSALIFGFAFCGLSMDHWGSVTWTTGRWSTACRNERPTETCYKDGASKLFLDCNMVEVGSHAPHWEVEDWSSIPQGNSEGIMFDFDYQVRLYPRAATSHTDQTTLWTGCISGGDVIVSRLQPDRDRDQHDEQYPRATACPDRP